MFVLNNVRQIICIFFCLFIFWHQLKLTNAILTLSTNALEIVEGDKLSFVVAIIYKLPKFELEEKKLLCGGSLVAPGFVLTAKHCLNDPKPKRLQVVIGSADLVSGVKCDIESWTTYDDWAKGNVTCNENDIAVIKLDKKCEHRTIKKVYMSKNPSDYFRSRDALAVGWGATNCEMYPRDLRMAMLNILDLKVSSRDNLYFSQADPPVYLQPGDSGTPLLVRMGTSTSFLIVGVAKGSGKFDNDLKDMNPVNVYTSIYYYLDFIKNVTNI